MKAVRERVLRPIISDAAVRRVEREQARLAGYIEGILASPCPSCGRATLSIEGSLDDNHGILIYCSRVTCSWKPSIKEPYPELNRPRR